MKTPRRPARRGSAMVELALFMTVLVPVIMYSGYLVDALFFSLKAQEAMSAAAWDMTGRLLHDYCPGNESSCAYDHPGKYFNAFNTVGSWEKGRYLGLDVWPADATGSALTALAGTGAKGFLSGQEVWCGTLGSGVSDPVGDIISKVPSLGSPSPATALHQGGLITCQAQATVQNYYLGNKPSTSTTIGPEQQTLWPSVGDITVCGAGGASGGSCPTQTTFVTYTDDWGLAEDGTGSGTPAWENWPDDSQSNYEFGRLGKTVFESTYPSYLQTAEAADETCFQSCCETMLGPVDDIVLLDKEFAMSTPYNAFNLAEMNEQKDGVGNASLDNQSYDPVDNYEGGNNIQQPSYTWPMEHYKAGPIAADANKGAWSARNNDYLGQ